MASAEQTRRGVVRTFLPCRWWATPTRQVHAIQRPDRIRDLRSQSAVRHARSRCAASRARGCRAGDPGRTVGFIRHLPHKLVESFRATLEESSNADLLLHVIDAHEPERDQQIEQVLAVLGEIGANELPMLEGTTSSTFSRVSSRRYSAMPMASRSASGCPPVTIWGSTCVRPSPSCSATISSSARCACRRGWGACVRSSSSWVRCSARTRRVAACWKFACRGSVNRLISRRVAGGRVHRATHFAIKPRSAILPVVRGFL